MTSLLTIDKITKRYQTQTAVNNVSFTIHKGDICGLVGENGAGKTTLLRILSGLIKPTSGTINSDHTIRLGALIESPALQLHLSAIDNLRYLSLQLNLGYSEAKLQEILSLVGLNDVDKQKKAKDFSLGMRQRLAIAIAILDKPEFLILDEPINGLDPMGIKEMRNIILNLRDRYQMTILISSHILSELELVVDRYIIMHKGKVIKQLSKEELNQELSGKIYLKTTNQEATAELLRSHKENVTVQTDYLLLPPNRDTVHISKLVLESNIGLKEIYHQKQSFEHYYLTLIEKGE